MMETRIDDESPSIYLNVISIDVDVSTLIGKFQQINFSLQSSVFLIKHQFDVKLNRKMIVIGVFSILA